MENVHPVVVGCLKSATSIAKDVYEYLKKQSEVVRSFHHTVPTLDRIEKGRLQKLEEQSGKVVACLSDPSMPTTSSIIVMVSQSLTELTVLKKLYAEYGKRKHYSNTKKKSKDQRQELINLREEIKSGQLKLDSLRQSVQHLPHPTYVTNNPTVDSMRADVRSTEESIKKSKDAYRDLFKSLTKLVTDTCTNAQKTWNTRFFNLSSIKPFNERISDLHDDLQLSLDFVETSSSSQKK